MTSFLRPLRGLLPLALAVTLAACGDSEENQSGRNGQGRVGFGIFNPYGNYGVPGGINGGGAGATFQTGNFGGMPYLSGSGDGGSLTGPELQALAQMIGNLSPQGQERVQLIVLEAQRSCRFPVATQADLYACQRGNADACGKVTAGMAMGLFRKQLEKVGSKLGTSQVQSYINQELAACGYVDLSDPAQVKDAFQQKKEACLKGGIGDCIGLFLLVAKLFLQAIFQAIPLLGGGLGGAG